MPIYAYRCPKCGATLDAWRSIPERDAAPVCIACSSPQGMQLTERLILPTNFNMNGSGSGQSSPETQWQFANLDDKPRKKLQRLSPDKIL